MASWFSWLPTLPSINVTLPSAIQRRFISFVLKKSLGHLLKPGQLDVNQIDSQIGSGYVQISDLHLNDQAINELLVGLPVELEQGSVASVTARIPWPNPISSVIGFSLDSLHLIFRVRPSKHPTQTIQNLSDSVASVAESFIHDELTQREEAILRESFHPDLASSILADTDHHNIPGSIDPFMATPEDDEYSSDTDPAGVSMFATLIERVLARFKFDAVNTKITLVHPGHSSISISITKMQYHTQENSEQSSQSGEVRTFSISGLTVAVSDLRPHPPSPSTVMPRTDSPEPSGRSVSPASSSSSLDEETQLAMSQSLAFLPPRANSPSASVSSSMYQSALADIPEEAKNDTKPSVPSILTIPEEVFFSFGTEPIVMELFTPPLTDDHDSIPPSFRSTEKLHLTITTGVVACAFRAWHIRAIMDLADTLASWTVALPQESSQTSNSTPLTQGYDASLTIRGLVLLTLPLDDSNKVQEELDSFFSHPLRPHRLSQGYIRLRLESISAFTSSAQYSEFASSSPSTSKPPSKLTARDLFSLSINDVSLFAISACSAEMSESIAYPLLVTDDLLASQYNSRHDHPTLNAGIPELPAFEVINWTEPGLQSNRFRLSTWRTRHKGKLASKLPEAETSTFSDAGTKPSPALQVLIKSTIKQTKHLSEVEVNVAPLHVFVDLDLVLSNGSLLAFVDEISHSHNGGPDVPPDDLDSEDETPPTTPRHSTRELLSEKEVERRRLERMVIEDLDLAMDYTADEPVAKAHLVKPSAFKGSKSRRRRKTTDPDSKVTLNIPMIRLQVRSPGLVGQSPRSGALVVDLHDIHFTTEPPEKPVQTKFTLSEPSMRQDFSGRDPLLSVGCKRVVIAYSAVGQSKAVAVLSIGSLSGEESGETVLSDPHSSRLPPLQPHAAFFRPASRPDATFSTLVLSVALPSVYVNLSKDSFDGLQYWADDVTQFLERTLGDGTPSNSRAGSMVGSRYFADSRRGSGTSSAMTVHPKESHKNEIVLKASIVEAFVRIMVPKSPQKSTSTWPFDIQASDVDVLVELKPEGKDETVVTVAVIDLTVRNDDELLSSGKLLSLATPRSLTTAPQTPVKLQFVSLIVPETTVKQSKVRLALWGLTCGLSSNLAWMDDLVVFLKAPPGAFESVIPSEKTTVTVKLVDCSLQVSAPHHPGAVVLHLGELELATSIVGDSPDAHFNISVPALAFLALDNLSEAVEEDSGSPNGITLWKKRGFVLVAEIADLLFVFQKDVTGQSGIRVLIDSVALRLHLCADTLSSITPFFDDLFSAFNPPANETTLKPPRVPTVVSQDPLSSQLMSSVEELAFRRVPEIGPAPDMIYDDLPTNPDYLDQSFSATAGFRELRDDDLEDFDVGETIKILRPDGLNIVEHHFDTIPPESVNDIPDLGLTSFRLIIHNANVNLFLYDGYDWAKTRRTIEDEVKEMRKRLAKIRQLVASGQTQDPSIEETSIEETSALLFNSVYIGLEQNVDELEPGALIAAIDEELREDYETVSQSSWQSLRPSGAGAGKSQPRSRTHGKRLTRSKSSRMEFRLFGAEVEFDQYLPEESIVSRVFATVKDLEILDQIKTSTWDKFLTELRSDSRGDIRETGSNMVKIELRSIRPVPEHPSEEARLRAKILPLRLYVDQDALDFLKKFFSFKDPHAAPSGSNQSDSSEIYFQLAEVFPVDLKLDYKPRRVDYRALREGRTIELMNFFHFDGAEMTLRHITLSGITGWPRLFDLLNDLWTPDVKATQLVDVISGVAPIRSVVNVGSGIADLVLLPIAQYKKDGRIVRGIQKGATAFVKSTATEAIKLGARLATGTQVILEQAEGVLGSQFRDPVTAETLQQIEDVGFGGSDDDEEEKLFSKYAEQPVDIREGVHSAYKSMRRNLNSAAQTILAVPMEVYERSGNEGPVRSVIRAVPIAVLKPMIGASEAVSKTLLGLHNTIDPNVRHDIEAKYKHR